jgi:hypothetical protein
MVAVAVELTDVRKLQVKQVTEARVVVLVVAVVEMVSHIANQMEHCWYQRKLQRQVITTPVAVAVAVSLPLETVEAVWWFFAM